MLQPSGLCQQRMGQAASKPNKVLPAARQPAHSVQQNACRAGILFMRAASFCRGALSAALALLFLALPKGSRGPGAQPLKVQGVCRFKGLCVLGNV